MMWLLSTIVLGCFILVVREILTEYAEARDRLFWWCHFPFGIEDWLYGFSRLKLLTAMNIDENAEPCVE